MAEPVDVTSIKKEIEDSPPGSPEQGDAQNPSQTQATDNASQKSAKEINMSSPRRIADCSTYHHLVSKPKTKSPVWEHFGLPADENGKVISDNVTICKKCSSAVASKGGSTSNMSHHLKVHHSNLFSTTKKAPSSSSISAKNYSASYQDDVETSDEIEIPHKIMIDFQSLVSSSTQRCTDLITKFLATTMQPYDVVEHKSFVEMVKTLNPHYEIPSIKYFSKTGVPKLYNDTIDKMKKELSKVEMENISITTDCWTSISSMPFLSITVHFVSPDWILKSMCITCCHFLENHTAENICEALNDKLLEWGINSDKIACCTSDNGTNILKAIHQLGLSHVSCFGHNINIGVNHAMELPQMNNALVRLKKLQDSISKSLKMKRDLARAQEFLRENVVTLPSACPTLWRSTLKLCRRFLDNQLPICKMLLDHQSKKHLMLEGPEISALQDFVAATALLEDMASTLCSEEYITSSSVLPLYRKIKRALQPEEGDTKLKEKIKSEILESLKQKYEAEPMFSTLRMSSLCDPRFRMHFAESPQEVKNLALKEMVEMYRKINENDNPEVGALKEAEPPLKKVKIGLAKFLDYCEEEEEENIPVPLKKAEAELKNYLAMPKVEIEENPLMWWKSHEYSFPLLKELAKKYSSIPGTSVPSERVFSTGRSIITKQRASLLPKNAEMLVILAQNKNIV